MWKPEDDYRRYCELKAEQTQHDAQMADFQSTKERMMATMKSYAVFRRRFDLLLERLHARSPLAYGIVLELLGDIEREECQRGHSVTPPSTV